MCVLVVLVPLSSRHFVIYFVYCTISHTVRPLPINSLSIFVRSCLGLHASEIPEDEWFCPDCQPAEKKKRYVKKSSEQQALRRPQPQRQPQPQPQPQRQPQQRSRPDKKLASSTSATTRIGTSNVGDFLGFKSLKAR